MRIKKNVLVVYYSQSGQLKDVIENLLSPFQEDNEIEISYYIIEPKKKFPFPWTKREFFDAFPESFQQIPLEIEPPEQSILSKKYDLVILGYQVWYLSPSIPINSFLKSDFSKKLLENTPVITVSGSRNMWIMAQEKIKQLLKDNNSSLVGNISFADRNINLISVITIVDWMFSGKKRKCFGILPLPGISSKEIKESYKFGDIILRFLKKENFNGLQEELISNNAVEVRHFLVSMDKKANKMFKIWSNIILKNKKYRPFLLKIFYYYLFFAIWVLSPIVHVFHLILYPFMYFKIQKQKKYFQGIE